MSKFCSNFDRLFRTSWLSSCLSVLLGIYYGTLDIWGEDWRIISEHKDAHGYIYLFLVSITIFSVVYKAYLDYKSAKIFKENELVLDKFIKLIRNIVSAKKRRFYDKATSIKDHRKRINFFNEITHPKDQIKYIMNQSLEFFDFWGVDRREMEMTVLGATIKDSKPANWEYILKLDPQRNHTDPNSIMTGSSLAHKSIVDGEPIFLSDLNEGIDQSVFLQSDRSKKASNVGSIYCKPVTIVIQNITYKFVFSIVSYGTYLCMPNNSEEAEQMGMILNQIGDRVELELYLLAMRQHKT